MMKIALIFSCVILGALSASLSEEEKKVQEIHEKCQTDPTTYVDHELLHHLDENINNPKVGAHMLCGSKAIGLQKPNGELDLDVIKQKIALSVNDEAKAEKLIKACAVKKETPEKTAVNLFMCLDKDGVTYFHEF